MTHIARNVVILGSTGSIGRNTLQVIEASGGSLQAVGLVANQSVDQLCEQAREFGPRWIHAADEATANDHAWTNLPSTTQRLDGSDAVRQMVTHSEVDVVVAAVVGSAGLSGAWDALQAGKTLALANKETLVVAGGLMTKLAESHGGQILPVDSEHSAVFQALQSGRRDEVKRIVLTASGGPFREYLREQLSEVSVEDALAPSNLGYGPEGHDRFGNHDEQGARDYRSALVVWFEGGAD